MKLSELHARIKEYEAELAYGSNTTLYGDWLARMDEVVDVPRDKGEWDRVEVPEGEAAWWLRAYELYEAQRDEDGQDTIEDLHELYDRVDV